VTEINLDILTNLHDLSPLNTKSGFCNAVCLYITICAPRWCLNGWTDFIRILYYRPAPGEYEYSSSKNRGPSQGHRTLTFSKTTLTILIKFRSFVETMFQYKTAQILSSTKY
jgi:hypothetical protein